eukprot:CAMPEP_0185842370 /NCGR_PEP_ID=MMETSP1353-20130828/18374_1 /TAXON_ID=1077150 /ORGANISM="Erythrolobus australicus, Strain CCMP3124" /LENGTH=224 /DNA_ID=CAMNT_0028541871 /DNA_START=108 /DNA_END=782 /DNA_ORIENTATION=-
MSTRIDDKAQCAPAAERNREPILRVLLQELPPSGAVLEIASGTGQHAAYFCEKAQTEAETPRVWLPTDPSESARDSINAWRAAAPPAVQRALCAARNVDVSVPGWWEPFMGFRHELAPTGIGAIVNINMIHISPWTSCLGLFEGAAAVLSARGGVLILYGPFKRDGAHTAPSNADFDMSLRARNPEWGVRDLADVCAVANAHGFSCTRSYNMPANNLSVIFHKN